MGRELGFKSCVLPGTIEIQPETQYKGKDIHKKFIVYSTIYEKQTNKGRRVQVKVSVLPLALILCPITTGFI